MIDTSAWAKLYHKSLFETVQYPVGKLFEDIATTYKLMLQCDKIAVGYQSKYNYIIRSNSIVNGKFNPKKLDLLEMTDNMGKEVLSVYPDLKKAVLRRRMYAQFSTLNQMLYVQGYEEDRKKIINFIKKYSAEVMRDTRTPKRDKVAVCMLKCGYPVYKFCWRFYLKIKK